MKLLNWIQKIGATVFFVGYFPWMPGTIGSALSVAGLWYAQRHVHCNVTPRMWWVAAVLLTALSMALSSRPKQVFNHDDPKPVIIDECAGQFITFFLIPLTLNTLVLGFLLFRFFDIVKPFPIYKMEELEGGVGITMDDVVAGIFANLTLMSILWGYLFVKAWIR
jgi:phosphatidylglycerophosphatase A